MGLRKYIPLFVLVSVVGATPALAQRRAMFQNAKASAGPAKAQKQAQNKAARQQQRQLQRQQQQAARRAQNRQSQQPLRQEQSPGRAGDATPGGNPAAGGPRLGDWLRQHRGM